MFGILGRPRGAALLISASVAAIIAYASPARAQEQQHAFNIPAQPLASALIEFGRQADIRVMADDAAVSGRQAPALTGSFTTAEGLDRLLAGSGLSHETTPTGAILVKDPNSPTRLGGAQHADATPSDGDVSEEIVVTGTNIRGVYPRSSPVQIYTDEDLRRMGVTTTEQFVQRLPQNFATRSQFHTGDASVDGGNRNFESVNSVDMRGLGEGTTLTLLNGRRLGSSDFGRGVDVSLIPAGAISRVEVLTDGASAIYGSDAIGGVVNFVLRDDFDGAETRVDYGGVTSGGLRQGDFTQMFGRSWGSGHALASFDLHSASALQYDDRSFTRSAGPGTLTPLDQRQSGLATFSQDLGQWTVGGDLMLSRRATGSEQTSRFVGFPLFDSFYTYRNRTNETFANLSSDYRFTDALTGTLQASYSGVDADFHSVAAYPGLGLTFPDRGETHFSTLDIAARLAGTAFHLPGGDLRFSIGAGVLDEDYNGTRTASGGPSSGDVGRRTTYAFAEAFAPLIEADQHVPFVNRLELSLAGRFTSYSDTSHPSTHQEFGDGTDPKVGLYWAPFEWLGLRGTYGTSFRAPSLSQLDLSSAQANAAPPGYPVQGVPANLFVTSPYPSAGLQPETATTYTLGFDIAPPARRSFHLRGTYYNIDYSDRIASAPSPSDILVNPQLYPDAIYHPPSAAYIEQLLGPAVLEPSLAALIPGVDLTDRTAVANALFALPNLYVLDNRLKNLALSQQDGFDLSVDDTFALPWGDLNVGASLTRILSYRQQGSPTSPVVSVSDQRGAPVNLRARAFATLTNGGFSGTVHVNYVDGYRNGDPVERINSWTTTDLTLAYDFSDGGVDLSHDLRLSFIVQNLFDADPPRVHLPVNAPQISFDAANANPLGRVVMVGLTKRW